MGPSLLWTPLTLGADPDKGKEFLGFFFSLLLMMKNIYIFVNFSGNNAQMLVKKKLSKYNLIWMLDMISLNYGSVVIGRLRLNRFDIGSVLTE